MSGLLTLFGPTFPSVYKFDFSSQYASLPSVLQSLGATYSRNSAKLNQVGIGQFDLLTANQFGTRYDPISGLFGYFPERAATNETLYSDNQLGAAWTATNITPTISATPAPYAGSNAYDLTVTSIASEPVLTQTFTLSGSNRLHTIYFYADSNHQWWRLRWKAAAVNFASAWFDAQNGVAGSTATGGTAAIGYFRVDNMGGGLYRAVLRCNAASATIFEISPKDGNGSDAYTTANGAVLTVWQHDNHGTATDSSSPIITGAGTASRLTDQLTIPVANIAGLTLSSGFTLHSEFVIPRQIVGGTTRILAIDSDGANTNAIFLFHNSTGNITVAMIAGGVTYSLSSVAASYGAIQKAAISYSPVSGLVGSVNGVSLTPNAVTTLPTGLSTVCIGNDISGTRAAMCLITESLVVTKSLTQAQLNAMTAL